jgi:hypothetical protein
MKIKLFVTFLISAYLLIYCKKLFFTFAASIDKNIFNELKNNYKTIK